MKNFENNPMMQAWKKAADELHITFVSPYSFKGKNRVVYICSGYLPEFGGPKGALICSRYDPVHDDVFDVAEELGYFASGLSPYHYEKYDKVSFIETLNDWGWFGVEGEPPAWFTGGIKCHGGKSDG